MNAAVDQVRAGLEYIVADLLVGSPLPVEVDATTDDANTVVLQVFVAQGDVGRVVGRFGVTFSALSRIVKAAGARRGLSVRLELGGRRERLGE